MAEYTLAQRTDPAAERARLARVQRYMDPPTTRHLDTVGVAPGWRCLDVGAGAGSIAAWLGNRVGASGDVLATDLEIDALSAVAADNIEVRRHDVRIDPLPVDTFDLVHTRLVLVHLPERDEVLPRMVGAAKPGGVVVLGDIDLGVMQMSQPHPLMDRMFAVFEATVQNLGWDLQLGRRLPGMLEANGLRDVEGECWQSYHRGGSALTTLLSVTFRRMRPLFLATGLISEPELDEVDLYMEDPDLALFGPTVWTAWGRRAE